MSSFARKLWNGRIPACFELAMYEVKANSKPAPYYVMLPRSSYLTLFTDKIRDFFEIHMETGTIDEVWFEFRGKTLKWHYPCGLLFDMCCDPSTDLPWHITVHFQSFPEKDIMRCPGVDAIESHYISVLKEADQLKHRMQVYSSLNQSQHKQLWHGLKTDNFEEFWDINKKFMEGHEGTMAFKNIPVRIYFEKRIIQKLFPSVRVENDSERDVTLHNALSNCIPELFEDLDRKTETTAVLIQGTTPPFNTPLQWLSKNLAYADNFLHICVYTNNLKF
ncbi:autophagy protein 5-like [Clavelina lepadiformis]|uniref:autophagy protein 5-like n=1 Tax=Clavelina lepadiformis TaxID=159417 RepID=UPI00404377CB